jgi:transcriptional regulator with XRE-family HTH domain
MDFWMRLKNEIKAQNTTQEWIARKINVPLSTFRKWMTRRTYPNIKEGVEIAKLLETSAEYLVNGVHPENISDEEKHLLNGYRKLSREDQENIMLTVEAWLKKQIYLCNSSSSAKR